MAVATRTDAAGPHKWLIHDEVVHLREWASSVIHPLPAPALAKGETRTIGAAEGSWLRLQDAEGRVSRQHAQLSYETPGGWTLSDLRSKNGVWLDGEQRASSFPITPGVEIRIGGITLIAESPLLCVLRELLSRLIGWSPERREHVDLALRSVRVAATQQEPLLLCAQGGNISIARLLHQYAIGEDRPFVVCDPRRVEADETSRAAANYKSGVVAFAAASTGTLCVWRSRLPKDFAQVEEAHRKPTARALLVVCSLAPPHGADIPCQLVVPHLADRASELHRIIDAYAADAVAEFGGSFTPEDRAWVAQHESITLAQIETATRRLVAIDAAGEQITRAASQLGVNHGTLSVWFARRKAP
jgi:FHA domain